MSSLHEFRLENTIVDGKRSCGSSPSDAVLYHIQDDPSAGGYNQRDVKLADRDGKFYLQTYRCSDFE